MPIHTWQFNEDIEKMIEIEVKLVFEINITMKHDHLSRLTTKPVWSESLLCAKWVSKLSWWDSGYPGWSDSSLGAHAILLVLSWGGSFLYCWQRDRSGSVLVHLHVRLMTEHFFLMNCLLKINILAQMNCKILCSITKQVYNIQDNQLKTPPTKKLLQVRYM